MLVIFIAICGVSCQKAEVDNEFLEIQESYISAEITQDEIVKSHLNNENYVVWDANDQIKVKGDNGTAIYEIVTGVGTTKGVFKKISGDDLTGESFVAYSPATAFDGTNLVWPISQQYVAEGLISGAPMRAEANSLKDNFQFKNLGGLVHLTLKSNEGAKNVSFIKIETEDNEIILNCPEGGVAVGESGTDFYLSIPTKEYSKFVVEATATDGAAFQKIATKNIKVDRSKITSITANVGEWLYLVSVSPTDKVIFSPGNLYGIDNGDGTYSFAFEARQTDYRRRVGYSGDGAVINGVATTTPTNTSGCFQWVGRKVSSASAKACFGAFSEIGAGDPVMQSDGDDVADFGAAYGDGETWRALSYDEWVYLLNVRKVQGKTGYGNTCLWATVSGSKGLIIFHDGYTGPTSGLTEIPEDCYFLPDAGYARIYFSDTSGYDGDKGSVTGRTIGGTQGLYWANNVSPDATYPQSQCCGIVPQEGALNLQHRYRDRGYSVRLVSDKWDASR